MTWWVTPPSDVTDCRRRLDASCDELRGGMDASQYKDLRIFMLFIKYVSDKYGNSSDEAFAQPVIIPKGASFKNMVALKGTSDIADKINTQVIRHFRNHQESTEKLIMKIETIQLGEIPILVTRKAIKNVHLSVHPPTGRVTLVAPVSTRLEVIRAYAISKLSWIRDQQSKLRTQAREAPRQFIERESHYLWGRRHLLTIAYKEAKPFVSLDHKRITVTVRPGSSAELRAAVIHEWHKSLLHAVVPALIQKWEQKLKVKVAGYFLQRMKTKWGSCNHEAGNIRLNTELVKKPKDLLEYVIVHEMVHLLEPTHNERFQTTLGELYPSWREARAELNELPLAADSWKE